STVGCDWQNGASGMCPTHYNWKFDPGSHDRVDVACSACGKMTTKPRSQNSKRRPACSTRCRAYLQFGRWPEDGRELIGPVPRRPLPRRAPTIRAPEPFRRAIFIQGSCAWCEESFLAISCCGLYAMC